jgi:hypothetical protein
MRGMSNSVEWIQLIRNMSNRAPIRGWSVKELTHDVFVIYPPSNVETSSRFWTSIPNVSQMRQVFVPFLNTRFL